ncbi:MAG: AraC family transcriptional regulator [Spirulinaceae cyanobacterium SM2_1_0]|nr:AraC family transcriptional regulator [Spirulinaceae cyanobacterium SM2_1_0]
MNPVSQKFTLNPATQIILKDLGLSPQDVLRRARLPLDLFSHPTPQISTAEYFRLWQELETLLSSDPVFPLRVGQSISVESFSPPIFACFCSENGNLAFKRLAQYKPLIGPLRLEVTATDKQTTIALRELPGKPPLPAALIAAELVFFVHMIRLATREHIVPLAITTTLPLPATEQFTEFFGIPINIGEFNGVVFAAVDVQKPFLTSNVGMWSIFEPELNQQMKHLGVQARFRDRVRACLMEVLASGQCSMADVAQRLNISTRTLQRRLREEETSFQQELSALRAELANHYLVNTPYSSAEISFLLGYNDPSSFFRAFHIWTGNTPDGIREMSRLS